MQIQLPPELEAQIRQDVERGPFASVDEFVEYAVALLHEQDDGTLRTWGFGEIAANAGRCPNALANLGIG